MAEARDPSLAAESPATGADDARRAIVIGAGPGGLTAAITLSRAGVPVAVFERSSELHPIGAGVGVQSNALRALLRIGVGQAVLEKGNRLQWSEMYSWRGRLILRLPMGEVADEFGTPTMSVLRTDLQDALVAALPAGVLRLGAECVEVHQDEAGVEARFSDGRVERGAVLIGADGGRSVVRRAVIGDDEPQYTGFTSWRAVIPAIELMRHDTSYAFVGRARMFVTFPCAPGTVYWGVLKVTPGGGTR